jgi:hypothetical protein
VLSWRVKKKVSPIAYHKNKAMSKNKHRWGVFSHADEVGNFLFIAARLACFRHQAKADFALPYARAFQQAMTGFSSQNQLLAVRIR